MVRLLNPVGEMSTSELTSSGTSMATRAANSQPRESAARSAGWTTTRRRNSTRALTKTSGV